MAHDRALDLADLGRDGKHVHVLELLDWSERVKKLGDESVIQLLVVLSERGLRHDIWLVVGRCIIILVRIGRLLDGRRGSPGSGWVLLLFLFVLLLCHPFSKSVLNLSLLLLLPLHLLIHSLLLHLFLLQKLLFLLFQESLLFLNVSQLPLLLFKLKGLLGLLFCVGSRGRGVTNIVCHRCLLLLFLLFLLSWCGLLLLTIYGAGRISDLLKVCTDHVLAVIVLNIRRLVPNALSSVVMLS